MRGPSISIGAIRIVPCLLLLSTGTRVLVLLRAFVQSKRELKLDPMQTFPVAEEGVNSDEFMFAATEVKSVEWQMNFECMYGIFVS